MLILNTALGRVRLIALIEAISFLALLCFAMPMKYFYADPAFIRPFGMAHGAFFVLLCAALLHALLDDSLNLKWSAIIFAASLVPILPFLLDKKIASLPQKANP